MKKTINNLFTRSKLATRSAKEKLQDTSGDFVLDHAMVFVIILVVGAVVITALVNYIENDFTDLIKSQINAFFNR